MFELARNYGIQPFYTIIQSNATNIFRIIQECITVDLDHDFF
jgi:hypothetical protein